MKRRLRLAVGILAALVVVAVVGSVALWLYVRSQRSSSGGVLPPEMAAYDVEHVFLDLTILPRERAISGEVETSVRAVAPLATFLTDLDDRLVVREVVVDGEGVDFDHGDGRIRVPLEPPWAPGELHRVKVRYGGRPKVALKAPWIGGFVWEETPGGQPWIGVACQEDGGDVWWPCKDHPSDRPERGVEILLTVPSDLVGLSNGHPLGSRDNGDGTTTSRWRVSYPINNYNVTVNVGPYVPVEERYHGVDGTLDVPILFWALPEHEEQARVLWRQAPGILEILGRHFGEYPFLDDKYWVVEAPYLGMEHQTLVAYGDDFTDKDFGFDTILLHETAHEWWGNRVTVADWADFWIHEGFATYAEALYVEDTLGEDRYLDYMAMLRRRIRNSKPIVQGRNLDSIRAYTGDIYAKGAWVLHMLRWLLGDEPVLAVLHDFSCDPRFARHHVTTEDFTAFVEAAAGRDLGWFWDRYLRRAELPRWSLERRGEGTGERLVLTWDDPAFAMPLPVAVDGEIRRIGMPGGRGETLVPAGAVVEVDPEGRVLAQPGPGPRGS